jgi:hypothetical protein
MNSQRCYRLHPRTTDLVSVELDKSLDDKPVTVLRVYCTKMALVTTNAKNLTGLILIVQLPDIKVIFVLCLDALDEYIFVFTSCKLFHILNVIPAPSKLLST